MLPSNVFGCDGLSPACPPNGQLLSPASGGPRRGQRAGWTHAQMSGSVGAQQNAKTSDPRVLPTFAKEKVIRHRQALS